jgi:hypothetical protein
LNRSVAALRAAPSRLCFGGAGFGSFRKIAVLGLGGCCWGREFALAVAVFPEHAQGALVLAAEHHFVALQQVQGARGVGQRAERLGLHFAVRQAARGQFARDEDLDQVGFHAADAAEAELGVGHFHDEVHFGGRLGLILIDVGVAEGDEVFGGFVEEEGGLGEEAVFACVLGGAGLARRGSGTGGFLGVRAPGGELFFGQRPFGFFLGS